MIIKTQIGMRAQRTTEAIKITCKRAQRLSPVRCKAINERRHYPRASRIARARFLPQQARQGRSEDRDRAQRATGSVKPQARALDGAPRRRDRPDMSAVAAIEHSPAPNVPKPVKPARISAAVRKAIHLLITGECKTQKAAAERVGISPVWLCIQLKKPAVQVFVSNATRENLAAGTMRAGARILELLDASSEHVSLDASKHVLAIGNIRPPDTSGPLVNIAITPGYVVKLRHAEEDARVIEHSAPDIRTQISEQDQ